MSSYLKTFAASSLLSVCATLTGYAQNSQQLTVDKRLLPANQINMRVAKSAGNNNISILTYNNDRAFDNDTTKELELYVVDGLNSAPDNIITPDEVFALHYDVTDHTRGNSITMHCRKDKTDSFSGQLSAMFTSGSTETPKLKKMLITDQKLEEFSGLAEFIPNFR